ncbi:Hypothetical predicted protein [Paramuricea clavata]|uniref:Uncharacterized protein n=1 Tax=Paramuricea clavata TaxID=317549 RepID=A0A6S7JL59_PARCT|nr:Hypothetical predicted protein [Paramuricea clavata]
MTIRLHIDARRFHTYVGNRVQLIRDLSKPNQWYHVAGSKNPADKASRGLTPKELVADKEWLIGPHFLWDEESILSNPESVGKLQPGDIEVKKREDIRIDQRCKNQRTSTKNSRTRSLQEFFLTTGSQKGYLSHSESRKEERLKDEMQRTFTFP